MITQTSKMPQSLWREQADRWLNAQDIPAPRIFDEPDDDHEPDPPPAAPALRPWPRVFPGL
jgi:hypothetical protein